MHVTILDSCTACGACEAINSDIFTVDTTAHVHPEYISAHEQDCIDAALICPVNAIWIEDL